MMSIKDKTTDLENKSDVELLNEIGVIASELIQRQYQRQESSLLTRKK